MVDPSEQRIDVVARNIEKISENEAKTVESLEEDKMRQYNHLIETVRTQLVIVQQHSPGLMINWNLGLPKILQQKNVLIIPKCRELRDFYIKQVKTIENNYNKKKSQTENMYRQEINRENSMVDQVAEGRR